jgi:hypothetical protein
VSEQNKMQPMLAQLLAASEEATKKKKAVVTVADVHRHDGPILLPTGMKLDDAIEVLTRKKSYDAEKVEMREPIKCFPWDGAIALTQAIEEMFGVALQTETEIGTLFGPIKKKPQMRSIEIGPGQTRKVPWGRFVLPGINGFVQTEVERDGDRAVFVVYAECTHGDEDVVKRVIARTREIALANSIYKSKAISIRFHDEDEDPLPIPQISFIEPNGPSPVFNQDLEEAIEVSVMTPIRHSSAMRQAGIPLKRGVLLAGVYGTGKTLTANTVAREATANGWTFIYVTNVDELSDALQFARDYQPAVVFAEDVDRAVGIARNDDVNEILNTLDGIGSKCDEIMTILTSNHPESINPAMRRPGRIDVVLEVCPPDADAAQRLVRMYGHGLVGDHEDLSAVGALLAGHIPAVIREAVERAKLAAINRMGGQMDEVLSSDLETAARVLIAEQRLFTPKPADKSDMELLGHGIAERLGYVIREGVSEK